VRLYAENALFMLFIYLYIDVYDLM